jgi:hypothetical protein
MIAVELLNLDTSLSGAPNGGRVASGAAGGSRSMLCRVRYRGRSSSAGGRCGASGISMNRVTGSGGGTGGVVGN